MDEKNRYQEEPHHMTSYDGIRWEQACKLVKMGAKRKGVDLSKIGFVPIDSKDAKWGNKHE